jgi:hypothetical protein
MTHKMQTLRVAVLVLALTASHAAAQTGKIDDVLRAQTILNELADGRAARPAAERNGGAALSLAPGDIPTPRRARWL